MTFHLPQQSSTHARVAVTARFICSTLLIALLTAIVQARTGGRLNGDQIYSRAMAAMRKAALPPQVRYHIAAIDRGIDLTLFCNRTTHHFEGSTVAVDNRVRSRNSGIITYNALSGLGVLQTLTGHIFLECAPFPFAPTIPAFSQAPITKRLPSPSPKSNTTQPNDLLKVITTVQAFYPSAYRVRNLGIEKVDGHRVYHLGFIALDGNESIHPITDALVDASTFLVRSVTFGGGKRGFIEGGGGTGTFAFGSASGYWVVKSINIVVSGHLLILHEAGSITITLSHFTFSQ